jgi:hypothetical protein
LLTAKNIAENFKLNKNNEFTITSTKVFSSSKYKVTNRKIALDRIENSIQCAEFYKNRLYVFHKLTSLSPEIGIKYIHDGYLSMNYCCMNEIMQMIYALKYYEGHEV